MNEREQNRILNLLDTVNYSASDNIEVVGDSNSEADNHVEKNVEKYSSDGEQKLYPVL